jgi:hypothetical protein
MAGTRVYLAQRKVEANANAICHRKLPKLSERGNQLTDAVWIVTFTLWKFYVLDRWRYVHLRTVTLRYVPFTLCCATLCSNTGGRAQSTYRNRVEIRGVYLPSQLERTHNFVCDGRYSENGGWACTPHHHQPGLIFPSWWNVRQKMAVATQCNLWCWGWQWIS